MSLEFVRTCGVDRLIAEGNWPGCRDVHSFALQGVTNYWHCAETQDHRLEGPGQNQHYPYMSRIWSKIEL